ncbi:MAG: c-type cytochrome [Nitrospirales bacterium]|nr:c-type cytochrome [Nitrospira sp.]MDR4500949.1 c-type cytochrome [Nitrospirales bacterium]
MTTPQLVERGEELLFGKKRRPDGHGHSGKAQCPVCHAFQPGQPTKRAPSLWGITARKRTKQTAIEYLAESHVCPSCYVVAGWALPGSHGCESSMPRVHLPPINLTMEELIAIDTWIYVHDGSPPPSPQTIRDSYHNILSQEEWIYVTRETQPLDKSTSVKQLFLRHACAGCHRIPGLERPAGTLGPPLDMIRNTFERLKEHGYQGHASSLTAYITESILSHDKYIAPDHALYAEHTLPSSFYDDRITQEDLQRMVKYLAHADPTPERSTHKRAEAGNCHLTEDR